MAAVTDTVRPTLRSPLLATLRGVAQVFFSASPWTGLLFTAALFVDDWRIGLFGVLGTAASTAAARWSGIPGDRITAGLEGYCGCLVGVAVETKIGAGFGPAVLTVFSALIATVVTAAGERALRRAGLTVLTAPFALVASLLAIALPRFERLPGTGVHAALPTPNAGPTHLGLLDVAQAFCNNIGEVFLLSHWYSGLIVLAGLVLAGRAVAGAAAAASLLAVGVSCLLGVPTAQIDSGLYGYNAVLTGIALAAVFLALTPWSAVYAAVGATASVVLTAAAMTLCEPIGGAPYTWPFILTTWLFLAAEPALERVRRRGP